MEGMQNRTIPVVLLATTGFLLAGCASTPPAQPTALGASHASPGTAAVAMEGYQFSPATLTVQAGATVTWTNRDPVGHTVTPTDKAQWGTPGSGDDAAHWLNNGQSWSFTFKEPGTYKYYCAPHAAKGSNGEYAGMVGTVVVQPAHA